MQASETIQILSKFRYVDKYKTFRDALPEVMHEPQEQRAVVTDIVNECCAALLLEFQGSSRPAKPVLRRLLIECMDGLSIAGINAVHREFGYLLGWYLADKAGVNLKKGTEKKIWGYWQIEGNRVYTPVRPRIAPKAKARAKAKQQQAPESVPEMI